MKTNKPLLLTTICLVSLCVASLIITYRNKPDQTEYRLKIIDNKAQVTDSEGNVNNIPLDGSLSKLITDINQ